MYLPDPAVFLTASIACVLGGGAIFWFLKTPKLALDALVLAAVCGLCYVVSAGYEAKEEAKIQPKLDAANAQLAALAKEAQQFQDAAAAAEAKAEAADAKAKSLAAQLHKSLLEAIHAQPAQVLTVLVPAPLVQLLDSAIDTTNAGRPSAVSGTVDAGATPAEVSAPDAGDWATWSADVIAQYDHCAKHVDALVARDAALTAANPQPVGAR